MRFIIVFILFHISIQFVSAQGTPNIKTGSYSQNSGSYEKILPDPKWPNHTPIKNVRVLFHVVSGPNGENNFSEKEAEEFAEILVNACNEKLSTNLKMHLPLNNETMVYPTGYRYVLTEDSSSSKSVFFHQESNLKKAWFWNTNASNDTKFDFYLLNKYGVSKGQILNIFLLSHPPDSIASKTYRAKAQGVGYPTHVYMAGCYQFVNDYRNRNEDNAFEKTANFFAGLLNHEIGHTLGLSHSWDTQDGCDDTPLNPGCWNYAESPPCNAEVSNNMMDYNAWQQSLTPCQLAIIHKNFNTEGSSQRSLLDQEWCEYDSLNPITIPVFSTVEWFNSKELLGDIILQRKSVLTIHEKVFMPLGSKIIISPGAVLHASKNLLLGSCSQKSPDIITLGKRRKKGTWKED